MPSIKQETLKGVKWTAIEKFSVKGVNFLLGLLMARLLSPSDFGTIGMLGIFYAISQTFIDSGFFNALICKAEHKSEDFSTAFYTNLGISLVCYAILYVIAPWVGDFFHTEILCPILRVQSVNLIINALMGVQVAKLTIELNFKTLAKRSFLSSIISGIAGVILAYYGFGVWALVWQSIILSITNLILIAYYCRWLPLAGFSKSSFHDLFSYGSKLLASGLLHTIYLNLTTIIIGKYFSAKDLGYYSRGTYMASYPVDGVNGVLQKVTFPLLAKIQNDNERLIGAYRKYIQITSMLIFFGCMLLASLAKPLILVLVTAKWYDAIIYLQIFAFSIMFDHLCIINLNLLQVKGRSDLFLKLEIIKKTISIAILFASIPFGVLGICVSKVIYTQIAVYINTYYTGKLFNLGYLAQFKDFSKYLIWSIIACIPSFVISLLPINSIVQLVLGTIVAVSIYYISLHRDVRMIEVIDVVQLKFRK